MINDNIINLMKSKNLEFLLQLTIELLNDKDNYDFKEKIPYSNTLLLIELTDLKLTDIPDLIKLLKEIIQNKINNISEKEFAKLYFNLNNKIIYNRNLENLNFKYKNKNFYYIVKSLSDILDGYSSDFITLPVISEFYNDLRELLDEFFDIVLNNIDEMNLELRHSDAIIILADIIKTNSYDKVKIDNNTNVCYFILMLYYFKNNITNEDENNKLLKRLYTGITLDEEYYWEEEILYEYLIDENFSDSMKFFINIIINKDYVSENDKIKFKKILMESTI